MSNNVIALFSCKRSGLGYLLISQYLPVRCENGYKATICKIYKLLGE